MLHGRNTVHKYAYIRHVGVSYTKAKLIVPDQLHQDWASSIHGVEDTGQASLWQVAGAGKRT